MNNFLLRCAVLSALVLWSGIAFAQRHRDPLTQPEIDKIRDASWEPKQRLSLYLEFTRARLVKMEEPDHVAAACVIPDTTPVETNGEGPIQ